MRPTRARAEEPDKARSESADERDARMEQPYVYDRRGERSTLAFVTTYRDDLVEEFFALRRQQAFEGLWAGEGIYDGLRRFERTRFRADLYASAHGVLLFYVRAKLDPADGGRKIPPGYFDRPNKGSGLPSRDADILAAKAARGHAMPRPRLTRRQYDERIAELERQRAQLLAEVEAGEAEKVRAENRAAEVEA